MHSRARRGRGASIGKWKITVGGQQSTWDASRSYRRAYGRAAQVGFSTINGAKTQQKLTK